MEIFSCYVRAALLLLSTAGTIISSPYQPVSINDRSAQEVVQKLNMSINNEKGYFVETFEDTYSIPCLNRSASTAIYYLLEGSAGDSVWHRVDAAEVWHYYAGAPLVLSLSHDDGQPWRKFTLGPDVFANERPQVVIASRQVNKQVKSCERPYRWDVQAVTDQTVLRQRDLTCLLPTLIARDEWQSARSLGNWTLVGTTVAPGFVSSELAPDGWKPSGRA